MQVKIKNVRISFPDIFQPRAYKDGAPYYKATFIIEPGSENDKAIRAAISAQAKEVYKDKAEKMLAAMAGNKQQFCYLDGDLSMRDEYAGAWTLSAKNKARPTVVDKHPGPDGKARALTEADGKPYAGCFVNGIVDIWAQSGETPGIRCKLLGVQFWNDGDAFSSSSRVDAGEFDTVAEEVADIF